MDADIQNQDKQYRRGLVLGLTMAEIFTLVVFALLLALAAIVQKRQQDADRLQARVILLEQQLHEFLPDQTSQQKFDDIFKELQRARAEVAQLRAANSTIPALTEKAKAADELKKALAAAGIDPASVDSPSEAQKLADKIQLANKITEAAKGTGKPGAEPTPAEIQKLLDAGKDATTQEANLRGQIANLNARLKATPGKGGTLPPCWADELTGKEEFIFDVAITPTGLIVHNSAPDHRLDEERNLPIADVEFDKEVSFASFVKTTQPLFNWSHKQDPECRFFVRRLDHTGPSQKESYKNGMKAIEAHFYKANVGDAP